MNLIPNAYADLPSNIIIKELESLQKCSFSWVVEKVKIEKWEQECSDNVYFYLNSINWYFKLNSTVTTNIECTGTSDYVREFAIWLKWKNFEWIATEKWYTILKEIIKNSSWKYYVNELPLNENIVYCTPNSNFVEFHNDIINPLNWILFISFILLSIFIYKKVKKV